MKPLLRFVVRTYEFFVGDPVLLVAVALAFGAGILLSRRLHEENLLLVVTVVGVIVLGIVTTIGRELGSAFQHGAKPRSRAERDGVGRNGAHRPDAGNDGSARHR